MKPFFSRYAELSEFLDDRPDLRADWSLLALLAVAGFCTTLSMHLLELPNWSSPAFRAAGERILATHDSYCWLAGAKGVGEYAGFGMAALARLLSRLTGAPLWAVGFYAPPALGSLAAVATGLWAWRLAGRRAAILAGLLGGLAPAFFYRSRLGYFDSDPFTLLMPLLLSLFLASLLAPCCTRAWVRSPAERDAPPPALTDLASLPWLAFGLGLAARVAHFAHDDIHPLGVGLFWLALGLGLVTALPGRRALLLRLLTVYALAAYAGPRRFGAEVFTPGAADVSGMLLAAGAAWLAWKPPLRAARWLAGPWPWLAGLAVLAPACGLLLPLGPFWAKALSYVKPVADSGLARLASGELGPSYPGITQSIREAKNVADLELFFSGVSFSVIGGLLSFAGILALLLLRPAFVLLVPITLLGFASMRLGARFAMFGGPAFTLGLGIGVYWLAKGLTRDKGPKARAPIWVQLGLAAGILVVSYAPRYADVRPTPVLGPAHAQALTELRGSTPQNAAVWTWWDYGYATQYYAERPTPTDGGRHAGRDIFPTALALTTNSYRQAAQLVLLSAGLSAVRQDGKPDGLATRWDAMPASAVQQELNDLRERDLPLPPAPPQYLVVCWENVPLLYWISFYGSWDVVQGLGGHASITQLNERLDLDPATGLLTLKSREKPLPLASAELLGANGATRVDMPEHPGGPHLLINELSRQAILLDDMAYDSMAVQLLIGEPTRPEQARYFKLLHEGFPLVRIYQVLPGPQRPAQQAEATQP